MCNKLKDCGGIKSFANCVSYQGYISKYSFLNDCDCHSVEETTKDIYQLMDMIFPNVKLEDFDTKCLGNVKRDKEGKIEVKDLLAALTAKVCEATSTDTSTTGCSDCSDPCSPGTCLSVVDLKYGSSEVQITNISFPSWGPLGVGYTDMDYTVPHDGTYKITIDLGCESNGVGARSLIGVSINNAVPQGTSLTNPFQVYDVMPESNSKTFHFVLTGVKKGTKLGILFKGNSASPVVVDGMKQIIEKI